MNKKSSQLNQSFHQRFDALVAAGVPMAGGRKGIEKESLRLDLDGYLSQTPHPAGLGSALTNRFITTDFSEALLEFVTPAYTTTWEALRFLCDVHQFTYEQLDDELLWVASMPCRIPEDEEIPLAQYGSSNVGQMKTIYRRGLGYRYGRQMQTIAGIHFNYSLPDAFWAPYQDWFGDASSASDFRSARYFGLVRNFRRLGWIVLYLFGASPAMCKSFGGNEDAGLEALSEDTWFSPFATSLRMSDLGYNNQNQSRINISLNNLDDYIKGLSAAINTPESDYDKIGVKVDGEYRQLSANRLQIENEYYSPIRPKRVARSGERPTAALRRGGVEYVEIRSLDISIDDPTGISQNAMRFIEAFLIYCLLEDAPPLDDDALQECGRNQTQMARRGRDPEFRLFRDGREVSVSTWALEILENVALIAARIDVVEGGSSYADAVTHVTTMIKEPERTPSARLLDGLRSSASSFFDYAMAAARGHADYFASIAPMSADRHKEFETEAQDSVARQRQIEAKDSISLEQYLDNYFAAE